MAPGGMEWSSACAMSCTMWLELESPACLLMPTSKDTATAAKAASSTCAEEGGRNGGNACIKARIPGK